VSISGEPAALPSAVVSLLVADLPAFVWWQGPVGEQDDGLLRSLADLATRVIVDSDQAGIDAVTRVSGYAPGLVDLAWARTTPWREATAALFDARPQRRALAHLMALDVRGPRNEARLLAGWLRSRLLRQVGLNSTHSSRLRRVELLCGDAEFIVEREARGTHGVAGGDGVPEHPVMLPLMSTSEVLARELDRLGADPVFEEALAAAA